jgi:hypothetical protein
MHGCRFIRGRPFLFSRLRTLVPDPLSFPRRRRTLKAVTLLPGVSVVSLVFRPLRASLTSWAHLYRYMCT